LPDCFMIIRVPYECLSNVLKLLDLPKSLRKMHTITVDRSPQPTLENKKLQLRIRFRKFSFKFLSLVSKTIAFHWKEILDLTSLDLTFMGESTIGSTGEKFTPMCPNVLRSETVGRPISSSSWPWVLTEDLNANQKFISSWHNTSGHHHTLFIALPSRAPAGGRQLISQKTKF